MIRLTAAAAAMAGLFSCAGDETLSGYGAADVTWVLATLDRAPFPARATLTFPEDGRLAGDAPCNAYWGAQTAPYPWFAATQITATRRACPDLDAEAAFFEALEAMTLAEVAGNTLLLSNDAGREMLFRSVGG